VIGLQSQQAAPRVLIVDDEPNNRGWLVKLLTIIGFATHEAQDGAVAIQLCQEWKPDLILIDMRMPVIDGIEATRRIRQQPSGKETVIIALTANAMHEDRSIVMGSGVDDFLSKPCQEDELLRKIQSHLNLKYLYDDAESARQNLPASARSGATSLSMEALPAEFVADLRLAIRNGEKDHLDQLIAQAGQWDVAVSIGLKDLADRYEYESLTHLLEGAAL
jgi:chemotaxis family two-component system sensor kinase Cph1